MIETVTLTCKNCGAALRTPLSARQVACAFCGSTHVLAGEPEIAASTPPRYRGAEDEGVESRVRILELAAERDTIAVQMKRSSGFPIFVAVFVTLAALGTRASHSGSGLSFAPLAVIFIVISAIRWSRRAALARRLQEIDAETALLRRSRET